MYDGLRVYTWNLKYIPKKADVFPNFNIFFYYCYYFWRNQLCYMIIINCYVQLNTPVVRRNMWMCMSVWVSGGGGGGECVCVCVCVRVCVWEFKYV